MLKKERPIEFLKSLEGKKARIILKWGNVYEGIFLTCDDYMNIVLSRTQEIKGNSSIVLGDVCIRCNNIKIIEEVPKISEKIF